MNTTCTVCFYPGLSEPAYHPVSGSGSLEICPCCGFQFGFTDHAKHISSDDWRTKWIANGMVWRAKNIKPPEKWDPQAQLANGGVSAEKPEKVPSSR